MIRATTPTHTFEFEFPIDELDEILIVYKQNGNLIKELSKDDLEIDGVYGTYKFSEEDTKKFKPKGLIYLQIRCAKGDTSMASDLITLSVKDVLDDRNLLG